MPDGIQQLGAQLAEALAPRRSDLVTVSYGTVKAVNETSTDVRLDVDLHGGTLYGLPMTTACRGVTVGDRVIVQTYGHLSTVTGVIAHDNSHYGMLLWQGDLTYGESAEIVDLPRYNAFTFCFGEASVSVVFAFRTGRYISGLGGFADVGGAFRIQSARATASGTTLTLLDDGGLSIWGAAWGATSYDRGANLTAVYGLL